MYKIQTHRGKISSGKKRESRSQISMINGKYELRCRSKSNFNSGYNNSGEVKWTKISYWIENYVVLKTKGSINTDQKGWKRLILL